LYIPSARPAKQLGQAWWIRLLHDSPESFFPTFFFSSFFEGEGGYNLIGENQASHKANS